MLFMVVERFRNGGWRAVGERFRRKGRMIPEGTGVRYVTSWMGADGSCCYQVMEAPDRAALNPWTAAWADLVDFEVTEIVESAAFWNRAPEPPPTPPSTYPPTTAAPGG